MADLVASEHGVFCLVLVLAATLLAALRIITGQDWITFAQWIGVTLVASKTITSSVMALKSSSAQTTPPTSS